MKRIKDGATPAVLVVVVVWIVMWAIACEVDRQHCTGYGLQYDGTDLFFDGYCRSGSVRVPAASLGAGR